MLSITQKINSMHIKYLARFYGLRTRRFRETISLNSIGNVLVILECHLV